MTQLVSDELRATVLAWIAQDPDPTTQAELRDLVERGDAAALEDRFASRLEFGTAGLRGLLGAGPNRMNRLVVIQATAGLCDWVTDQVADGRERGIVIGYDGRRMSAEFAEDAAAIACGKGYRVFLFPFVVPTPVLSFAVEHLGCAAGIMVTASHNPPEYNGYKVYWGNAAQIIPPHDTGIAQKIEAITDVRALPRLTSDEARAKGLYQEVGEDTLKPYYEGVAALRLPEAPMPSLRIAYTAMHGVGDGYVARAMAEAGYTSLHSEPSQQTPDGEFPTVRFPNPEEDGAMDRVLALAESIDAELVLANDPDADRLAAAGRNKEGEYELLSGNDVGCLLAHYLLTKGSGDNRAVLSSIVSSPMLGAIAKHHGAHWEPTLTGFKWIANRAMDLEAEGKDFVMGYEEALGYSVGSLVRDKDGVSAAVLMAELTAESKRNGQTLLEAREAMWRQYGLFMSRQVSVVLPGAEGAAQIADIMTTLRAQQPTHIGQHGIVAVADIDKSERRTPSGELSPVALPKSNVLLYEIEGGHRIMARPSGTEPKIKFYYDVRVEMAEGESIEAARSRGEDVIEALCDAFEAMYASAAVG